MPRRKPPHTHSPLDEVVAELRALRLEVAGLRSAVELVATREVPVVREVSVNDVDGVHALFGRVAERANRAFQ